MHAMVAEIALLGAIELSAAQAKDLELILNAFKNVAHTGTSPRAAKSRRA